MYNKKGFLKIMEVFLAITMVFIFMLYTQNRNIQASDQLDYQVFEYLSFDSEFRDAIFLSNNFCISKGDNKTINRKVEEILPLFLNYTICAYEDPNFKINSLPDKKIYVESYYFSSLNYSYNPRVVKLFYWK